MRNYSKLEPAKNRRLKMLEKVNSAPFKVGDEVYVMGKDFSDTSNSTTLEKCTLCSIDDKEAVVERNTYGYNNQKYTVKKEALSRKTWDIGFNPFPVDDWHRRSRTIEFDNEGVLYWLFPDVVSGTKYDEDLREANMNPMITDKKGNKHPLQRGFVWTLKDKQALIDSIYGGIHCGSILVRAHSWKEVERHQKAGDVEFSFKDVIDGKQRVSALLDFVTDQFTDSNGWYFSELAPVAQREFLSRKSFACSELGEDSTDLDAVRAFIGVNFTGVPQDAGHIYNLQMLDIELEG